MKKFIAIAFFLISGLSFAQEARNVDLNSDLVNLGTIAQNPSSAAFETITITRTSATPLKVKLLVNYFYQTTVCTREEIRDVWVPGSYVCNGGHHGHPDCYPTPGYYRQETYCAEYSPVINNKSRELSFDFSKANILAGPEVETFNINMAQKSFDSDDLKYSASVVSAKSDYEIKSSGFLWWGRGLQFKAIR